MAGQASLSRVLTLVCGVVVVVVGDPAIININFAGMLNGLNLPCPSSNPSSDAELGDRFLLAARDYARYDGVLSERTVTKKEICANNACLPPFYGGSINRSTWVSRVRASTDMANYTDWACGLTLGNLAEIWGGLTTAFDEYHDGLGYAGYQELTTRDQIVAYFQAFQSSSVSLQHRLRLVGTSDHVWVIEQQPQGYRIYQSYHEAYSLKAWLAETAAELRSLVGTDIITWSLFEKATETLRQLGLTWDNFEEYIPDSPLKNWLRVIQVYNATTTFELLLPTWQLFGGGRVISRDVFFNDYIETLANLVQSMLETESSESVWTQEQHTNWTHFSGAYNPQQFPGIPFSYSKRGFGADQSDRENCRYRARQG